MTHPIVAPRRGHGRLPFREGETIVTALYRAAAAMPGRPALLSRGFGRDRTVSVTYGQLLGQVEAYADALTLCGARRGEAIALQMPNCWGSATLLLACLRIGAVVVPLRQAIGAGEFGRALAATDASMCVVLDSYLGRRNAETLLSVSDQLPALRHRVVVGDARATGALDFERLCADRTGIWERDSDQNGPLPGDLGEPCLVVPDLVDDRLTTTGYRHAALCAEALALPGGTPHDGAPLWVTPGEVFGTSYPFSRTDGLLPALWQPLLTAGTGAFLDDWDPAVCLELYQESGVTRMSHPADHWAQLVAEQRRAPVELPRLRDAVCRCDDQPPGLAAAVREAFGVPLRALPQRHRVPGRG